MSSVRHTAGVLLGVIADECREHGVATVPTSIIMAAIALLKALEAADTVEVPMEPTDAMLAAADDAPERAKARSRDEDNAAIYRAMLAAAHEPETGAEEPR